MSSLGSSWRIEVPSLMTKRGMCSFHIVLQIAVLCSLSCVLVIEFFEWY